MSWRRCATAAVGGFGSTALLRGVTVEAQTDGKLDMVQSHDSNPNRFGNAYRKGNEFPDLKSHFSYMAKFLTPEMYEGLSRKQTAKGFTLDHSIQGGVDVIGNPFDPQIGLFAGDEESYYAFAPLYNRIISARHDWLSTFLFSSDINPTLLRNATLPSQYIVGVRIRASRNLANHRFSPHITRGERREIEFILLGAMKYLSAALKGNYHSIPKMTAQSYEEEQNSGVAPPKPTGSMMVAGGCVRDWPDARGFYMNNTRDFLVWINEHDHLKVITTTKGGRIGFCIDRLGVALGDIELGLQKYGKSFAMHRNIGYLSPSLSNVGTGFQIAVTAKLPHLAKHPDFHDFLKRNHMQTSTKSVGGTVQLLSTRRLGLTEVQIAQEIIDALHQAISFEKSLEKGKAVQLFF